MASIHGWGGSAGFDPGPVFASVDVMGSMSVCRLRRDDDYGSLLFESFSWIKDAGVL